MSVQSEIDRLSTNVSNTLSAIAAKGVSVPDGSSSDDMALLVTAIPTGMQLEPLWTNASQDSAFAAQTITIPTLKNYPMYAIETGQGTYFRKALDGYFYMSVCATWSGTDCYVLARNVNVTLSTGTMAFSNAIGRNLLGGGGGQSNTEQVPRVIYGVKGVPN